ncbi:TrmB family transcriptional regulator [Cohnella rhizosphaerae]|uniref:TrmB family transcriptional regulator n=1 Tax=Cohnella rhizosphaerae TaxID=1457232 RepID=A0A9X4KWA4_9BACL|nr:helix-turn-helix domain-containing protein [Cohnella rhizosphaerae]MDG0812117.1 TrmB family transcriptional regulator [Cohnella rhizosphaerae]
MIEKLKRLGLSELEARCYVTLHEEAALSGYEVAKRVSVSRTNVYAALRSLVDKGVCRAADGDPVMYAAVPVGQVIRMLRSEFDEIADVLVKALKPKPAAASFYNWSGEAGIRLSLRRMIASAERSIVVDIWSEDFAEFEPLLLEAEARGVVVVAITLGQVRSKLKRVRTHKRMEMWLPRDARDYYVLCDWKEGFIGSFGAAGKSTALETNHPAVAHVLKQAFQHDVMMMDIERDFGPELERAYGGDYEKLLERYREQYGLD